jgi:uncharacterized protein YkwD
VNFLLWAAAFFLAASPALTSASPAPTPTAEAVLKEINVERAKAGLGPLILDDSLQAAAQEWAQTAARRQSLTHRKDLKALIQSSGWGTVNENIYMGTGAMTPARIVRAWMASPGHRKNLLSPRITAAGLGIATHAQGATYVVFNGAGP